MSFAIYMEKSKCARARTRFAQPKLRQGHASSSAHPPLILGSSSAHPPLDPRAAFVPAVLFLRERTASYAAVLPGAPSSRPFAICYMNLRLHLEARPTHLYNTDTLPVRITTSGRSSATSCGMSYSRSRARCRSALPRKSAKHGQPPAGITRCASHETHESHESHETRVLRSAALTNPSPARASPCASRGASSIRSSALSGRVISGASGAAASHAHRSPCSPPPLPVLRVFRTAPATPARGSRLASAPADNAPRFPSARAAATLSSSSC